MNTKKIIYCILFFITIVGVHANNIVCSRGICFQVISESEWKAEQSKLERGVYGAVKDFLGGDLKQEEKPAEPIQTLEELVQTKTLKAFVGFKELEWRREEESIGSEDYAVMRSVQGNEGVVRIISGMKGCAFDITVVVENGAVHVKDIQEISEEEWKEQKIKQQKEELNQASAIGIDQAPFNYADVTFALMPAEGKERVHVQTLEEIMQEKCLAVQLNDKELGLVPYDMGTTDRVLVQLVKGNDSVLRVVAPTMQRVWDVMCSVKDNKVGIVGVQEVSKEDYWLQHLCGLGLGCFLSVNQTPLSYGGVAFALVPGNSDILMQVKNVDQLIKAKGLRVSVNGNVLELVSQYGSGDRAVVRSVNEDQCVIRVASGSLHRVFDVTLSIKEKEVFIKGIMEVSKADYIRDLLY